MDQTLFSQRTIDFLVENRLRNDKEWFNAHKEQYQKHVIEPFVYPAAFASGWMKACL